MATTGVAFSQTAFGIKAGLNVSNIHYNIEGASPEGATGLYAGTFVDFTLSPKFHLQPEVMYSVEGIKDGSVTFVNVPVVLKWFFAENIQLHAGPQLGVVIDAEGGTNGLESTILSGVFGLGYEMPSGFQISTRFAMGATSIIDKNFKVDSGMGYDLVGIKGWTRTFQLGLGYKF
ncbi:hypothetical protein GCM10010465_03610 [Actinomadura fibrosa]